MRFCICECAWTGGNASVSRIEQLLASAFSGDGARATQSAATALYVTRRVAY